MNDEKLFSTIVETVSNIDKDLNGICKKSIFFAPELYVAFLIGREIKINESDIFNESVEWLRELNLDLGNPKGGPIDIVFNYPNTTLAIELKMVSKFQEYVQDIEKLLKLRYKPYQKYFCALVDSDEPNKDNRLTALENQYGDKLRIVGSHSFLTTWNRMNVKQVNCLIRLYEVI
jgi:hypothetical protein